MFFDLVFDVLALYGDREEIFDRDARVIEREVQRLELVIDDEVLKRLLVIFGRNFLREERLDVECG